MAFFETEKYFESEKVLPKISQSDFCTDDNWELSVDTTDLINHLKNIEPIYHEHLVINNNKPDARVCNEILFSCIKLFEHKYDICIIYNEIIDFFGFDNCKFYSMLNVQLKYRLKNALSKRISLDTFEKHKKEAEAKQGGAYTPSFADLLKGRFRK